MTPDYAALAKALSDAGLAVRLSLVEKLTGGVRVLFPISEKRTDEDSLAFAVEFAILSVASDVRDRQGGSGLVALQKLRAELFEKIPEDAGEFTSIQWQEGKSLAPQDRFWFWEDRFIARYELPYEAAQLNDYRETSIDEA